MDAEKIAQELSGNPALFSKVLDHMIEMDKSAKGKIPKKVEQIADAIRRDTGASDEKAYRIAWQTYIKYVNPSYPGATEAGKTKKMVGPKSSVRKAASANSEIAVDLSRKLNSLVG
jgi:hypothetical protein